MLIKPVRSGGTLLTCGRLFVYSNDAHLGSMDALMTVRLRQGYDEPLRPVDVMDMFEGEHAADSDMAIGGQIRQATLEVGLSLLVEHLLQADGGLQCLVGTSYHFQEATYARDYSENSNSGCQKRTSCETNRMASLRRLLKFGTGGQDIWCSSSEEYGQYIRSHFSKVVLLYHMEEVVKHFIVLELVFANPPYIKVWDGMGTWSVQHRADWEGQIKTLTEVFFGKPFVRYIIPRQDGDPLQEYGNGCGPFAFLTACHLAQGRIPPPTTVRDEACARSYLWGSIVRGQLQPLPLLKLN